MNPIAIALVQVAVGLIITAIAARLSSADGVKKKGLDDFKFPTVSQERAVPVVFGDILVEGSNVTWFGDYKSKKIKEGGGLFSPGVVVGHTYSIGMEFCLCWGEVDQLREVWFGDNKAFDYEDDNELISLDEDVLEIREGNLFGGKGNGGGVEAALTFYSGSAFQEPNNYMTGQVGKAYSHRGICKVIFNGPSSSEELSGKVGESNIIPPVKFRVEHYPNFLGTGYKKITSTVTGVEGPYQVRGANPAEVVYCLLIGRYANVQATDPVVPVIPDDMIDKPSFTAAAATLNTEGMGISFQWQRDTAVKDIIDDIMQHVDGYLAEDSSSGLIKFTLNRQDYNPATLPVFDESNIVDFSSYVRINPNVAVNRLNATFTDVGSNYKQVPIMVEDLGNSFEQNMGAPGDLDLHMFQDPNVAILRATRELVQLSEGIVSGTFIANRDAYNLNIGAPIKISWDGFGVQELVVRVIEKKTGSYQDRKIEIKFVQDIFGIGDAIYGVPGGTGWTDIFTDPQDIVIYQYFEQPRYFRLNFDPNAVEQPNKIFLITQFPTSDTLGYKVLLGLNGETQAEGFGVDVAGTENNSLAAPYLQSNGPGKDTVVGMYVVGGLPDDYLGTATQTTIQDNFKHWILVNDELMAFESSASQPDGSIKLNNVYRGLADTVPAYHPAGSTVYYLGDTFQYLENFTGEVGDILSIKTITTAGGGVLEESAAANKNYTIIGRDDFPYPPANIRINSGYYPDFITGELLIEWDVRDGDEVGLTLWDTATSHSPEAGGTTSLNIYDSNGALIKAVTGLTGEDYTYPLAEEVLDAGAVQDRLTVELFTVATAGTSLYKWAYTFDRQIGQQPSGLSINLDVPALSAEVDVNIDLDVPA